MNNAKQNAKIILKKLKRLFPIPGTILKFSNHWELLVAVMLSAQTSDAQVNKATKNLFQKYPTLQHYVDAHPRTFEKNLSSINYYKTKARHIRQAAKILHEIHGGVLPKTLEELIKFPGVGRKTALVVLGNAYGIIEGIAVDTHVRRLTHLFGLTTQKNIKRIEQDLQKIFPKEEWFNLTNRLIAYGRTYCSARCTHKNCPLLTEINLLDQK
ncbi:MAG: endonuclease III [Candidatus Magasanikbacteria bacterium]